MLKLIAITAAGVAVCTTLLITLILRAPRRSSDDTRHAGKGSIMETRHERMSIFSADNVRLLSEAQIRAIEEDMD
jgi:hypothetical protein